MKKGSVWVGPGSLEWVLVGKSWSGLLGQVSCLVAHVYLISVKHAARICFACLARLIYYAMIYYAMVEARYLSVQYTNIFY